MKVKIITDYNEFLSINDNITVTDVKAIKTKNMVNITFIVSKTDGTKFDVDRTNIGALKQFIPISNVWRVLPAEIINGSYISTAISLFINTNGAIYFDNIKQVDIPSSICIDATYYVN